MNKFRFKWTSFTNPEVEASVSKDPDVDQVSFLVAVALWLMEHSHMVIVFNLLPVATKQTDSRCNSKNLVAKKYSNNRYLCPLFYCLVILHRTQMTWQFLFVVFVTPQ